MRSAVKADNLEAALEAAIRRFDGSSPVTLQVHQHFGEPAGAGRHGRMQLVLAVALAEGGRIDDALDVACAVEILSNSTLVHADLRGGRPSPFGLAHGINAGDALCAMAYLELLDEPVRRPPERTVLMTRALHAANYLLCAGDAAEIAFERGVIATADAYLRMLEGKAALFAVACELGALVAGAVPERAQAYARLGRSYGMAFQMESHVQTASERRWALPEVASAATARRYLAEADAAADAAGVDAHRDARAALTRAIRSAR
jgi:geranylgeranyl diphosphate synthase type I